MKFLIVLSIISSFLFEFNKTSNSNKLKEKAAIAFQSQQYLMAIRHYHELVSVYKIKDEGVLLNLAHAYFKLPDHTTASYYYKQVLHSQNREIRCEVNLQLGVIAALQGKGNIALSYFKAALKADATNDEARFNYELISKKMRNGKASSKLNTSKNKRQQKTNMDRQYAGKGLGEAQGQGSNGAYPHGHGMEGAPSSSEAGNAPSDKNKHTNSSDREGDAADDVLNETGPEKADALQSARFSEIHISEAKARMLLENMKHQELILLNRKSNIHHIKKKSDKPDW